MAILAAMVEPNQTRPALHAPRGGTDVSLADFAGKTVVLYFYPKADTPGG